MLMRLIAGLGAGWVLYMAVWLGKDFHGGLESIIQPVLGGIVSAFFVGVAFVLGLPLKTPFLRRIWRRLGLFSPLMTVAGVIAIFYAEDMGLSHEVIHPETEEPVQAINTITYLVAFLGTVFPWVNWPRMSD